MKSQLRYFGISHHSATVAQRERFHIPEAGQAILVQNLRKAFPDVTGILLLITCNRTEVYLETSGSPAREVLKFFLDYYPGHDELQDRNLFAVSERTRTTIGHLLQVSAGLESSVIGDAEIVHQIRDAFRRSMELGVQGSLLERAMQTVFRAHKRISNETAFRDGTTSTAYKALKMIGDSFGNEARRKRILLVGAGDIVRQILKYNVRFGYRHIWITNRTEARAAELAQEAGLEIWPWKRLLANELEDFDVVIAAAAHAPALIRQGLAPRRKILLIDLAVPGNIGKSLGSRENIIRCDLDTIASQLERNKAARSAAIQSVLRILASERADYLRWFKREPFRQLLADRKQRIRELLRTGVGGDLNPADLEQQTNRIVRQLLKNPEVLQDISRMEPLVDRLAASSIPTNPV